MGILCLAVYFIFETSEQISMKFLIDDFYKKVVTGDFNFGTCLCRITLAFIKVV
jgi:hypothetical protein